MKKILLLLITASSMPVFGQLTISSSDYGSVGDTVHYAVDTTLNINIGNSGTGQTWNFSTLSGFSTDTIYFVNPSTLPGYATFPTSNVATKSSTGQSAFYNKSTTDIEQLGIAVTIQSNLNTITYTPPKKIMVFPATYQTTFNSTLYSKTAFYIGIDTTFVGCPIKIDSVRDNRTEFSNVLVDAEGQLILPSYTSSALRVKNDVISTDSIFVYSAINTTLNVSCIALGFDFPQGWSFAPSTLTQTVGFGSNPNIDTSRSYFWLAANGKLPLVTVNVDASNNPVGGTSYQMFDTTSNNVSIQQLSTNELIIYPNPASHIIKLQTTQPIENGDIRIYDMAGRLVKSKTIKLQQPLINITDLKAGSYIINIIEYGRISYVSKFNVER